MDPTQADQEALSQHDPNSGPMEIQPIQSRSLDARLQTEAWQFLNEHGQWNMLDEEWQETMLEADADDGTFQLTRRNGKRVEKYEIDIKAMTQRNLKSGTTRALRNVMYEKFEEVTNDGIKARYQTEGATLASVDVGPYWHWQYRDNNGWQNFDERMFDETVTKWLQGQTEFRATHHWILPGTHKQLTTTYELDLVGMTQRSRSGNNTTRAIRLVKILIVQ